MCCATETNINNLNHRSLLDTLRVSGKLKKENYYVPGAVRQWLLTDSRLESRPPMCSCVRHSHRPATAQIDYMPCPREMCATYFYYIDFYERKAKELRAYWLVFVFVQTTELDFRSSYYFPLSLVFGFRSIENQFLLLCAFELKRKEISGCQRIMLCSARNMKFPFHPELRLLSLRCWKSRQTRFDEIRDGFKFRFVRWFVSLLELSAADAFSSPPHPSAGESCVSVHQQFEQNKSDMYIIIWLGGILRCFYKY